MLDRLESEQRVEEESKKGSFGGIGRDEKAYKLATSSKLLNSIERHHIINK
jgi:hypothetical protein